MSAATIYDVARQAGVSAMTVSRVINGSPKVDQTTRTRVKAAIVTLQYQVNLAARSARKGTLRIGLLLGSPGAAFMCEFLVGAMDQCSLQGAQLIVEKCGDLESQRAALARLIANGADCILVPPPLCDLAASLRQLDEIGVPVVAVASARPAGNISAVGIDDYRAATAMMHHLFASGHRDIAFIQGDPGHAPARLRYQAYLDALGVAGIAVRAERVAEGLSTYRSGLAAAHAVLGRPDLPSAVFACNDDMAAAVISVAHAMRLRVPQDLAVCGFDDTPIAATVWPELSTIQQPIDQMARVAVRLAIEAIGEPRRARHSVLPYTLVVRASTSARAVAAPECCAEQA
ncbi:LacI family DNA-binding transcriptional regulator [Pseudoduganella sp. LjRoot289]|uniref:LacI family DNA-binding transcriptional regulator n=1 Tax=Pseudoduganella sp. LjRoot289 TaxID=3342314 RepID=UPI003ECF416D